MIQRLREDLDAPSLEFKVPPRKIAEGGDAIVYSLELSKAHDDATTRQVLRVFRPSTEHHDVEVERYVMNALAERGFPAPPSLWGCNDAELFGAPAMLCDHLSGRQLLGGGVDADDMAGRLKGVAADLRNVSRFSSVVAELAIALQEIDAEAIFSEGRSRGLNVDSLRMEPRLERLRERIAHYGEPGLEASFAWLQNHVPPAPKQRVLCHGDLNPTNLLMKSDRVTGVLDWSALSFGHPAREVGVVRSGLRTIPLLGPIGSWIRGRMADSLTRHYTANRPLDEAAALFFEAWILIDLTCNYRDALHGLRENRGPWDNPKGQSECARYFEAITGVPLPVLEVG